MRQYHHGIHDVHCTSLYRKTSRYALSFRNGMCAYFGFLLYVTECMRPSFKRRPILCPAVYGRMPELFFSSPGWNVCRHISWEIFFERNFNVQIAVMRAWTTVLKDAQFSLKKNVWMGNSWKICSKRCAIFIKKKCMYGCTIRPTYAWKICSKRCEY